MSAEPVLIDNEFCKIGDFLSAQQVSSMFVCLDHAQVPSRTDSIYGQTDEYTFLQS